MCSLVTTFIGNVWKFCNYFRQHVPVLMDHFQACCWNIYVTFDLELKVFVTTSYVPVCAVHFFMIKKMCNRIGSLQV